MEDIIGSNKFVEEIEKIETEVERLKETKVEKTNRHRTAARELDGLENGKNEALTYV